MKINMCFLVLFVSVFLFFSGCPNYTTIGEISIKNDSGQTVTDLLIFVSPLDRADTKKIDQLLPDNSITVRYDLGKGEFVSSARSVTGSAGIEYYINGVKFGMDDGNRSIGFANNQTTFVTLNADGWIVHPKW